MAQPGQSGYLWEGSGLHPCKLCGAALRNGERVRGHYWNPEVPLDAYEAVNLLEALKLVPDTGDWHGQLRLRCQAVIDKYGDDRARPNMTAERMREHAADARVRHLEAALGQAAMPLEVLRGQIPYIRTGPLGRKIKALSPDLEAAIVKATDALRAVLNGEREAESAEAD